MIEVQLERVAELNAAGEFNVENIDVFCEKGVFDVEQTRRILRAGKSRAGLRINFHGEELSCLGSAEVGKKRTIEGSVAVETTQEENEKVFYSSLSLFSQMGAELEAEAISHLEEVSAEGIRAMAASGSVAVVLPTTAYILRLKSPPVRRMLEAGVIVALGTDFNPNAFCLSMVRIVIALFVCLFV